LRPVAAALENKYGFKSKLSPRERKKRSGSCTEIQWNQYRSNNLGSIHRDVEEMLKKRGRYVGRFTLFDCKTITSLTQTSNTEKATKALQNTECCKGQLKSISIE